MDLKEIIKRNYEATKKRGKINNDVTLYEFEEKIKEELKEFSESIYWHEPMNELVFDEKELIDIMTVCTNTLIHYGFDVQRLWEENTIYNEKRRK